MIKRLVCILVILVFLAGMLPAVPARAAVASTFTVNTFDDPLSPSCPTICSLREAIDQANAAPGSTVVLPPGIYNVWRRQIDISADMTINGQESILDAGNLSRLLSITSNVTINDLTFRSGTSLAGSAINFSASGKTLTLNNTEFQYNTATGGDGGAIYSTGHLVIHQSLFDNNSVTGSGGAIYSTGSLTMDNTTLSANRATMDGGAIVINTGTATLTNDTIAFNKADTDLNNTGNGGGLSITAGATVTLIDTILSNNADLSGIILYPDCAGDVTVTSHNNLLTSGDGCVGITSSVTNQVGVDPGLKPLDYNGGPLRTHAIDGTSLAADKGAGCAVLDQRGLVRPPTICDIGAYEFKLPFQVNSPADSADADLNDTDCLDLTGHCTLRAALQQADAEPGLNEIEILATAGIIRDNISSLVVHDSVYIYSKGAVVEAGGFFPLFQASAGKKYLEIRGLSLRPVPGEYASYHEFFDLFNAGTTLVDVSMDGGAVKSSAGSSAISVTSARLALVSSLITNVLSFSPGAGIDGHSAFIQLADSTLSGNVSEGEGGGLAMTGGSAELRGSTIRANTAAAVAGGGGVSLDSTARLRLSNTIIAGNSTSDGAVNDCKGAFASEGYNLIGAGDTCNGFTDGVKHDHVGNVAAPFSAGLSALGYYGGLTRTHSLGASGAAYNGGNPAAADSSPQACSAFDQRGARRTLSICDIGAYEYVAPLVVTDAGDSVDATPGDGVCKDTNNHCTLRAAIDESNANPDLTSIQLSVVGPIVLTIPGTGEADNHTGNLNINEPVELYGAGPYASVIDGGRLDGVLTIASGANTVLRDLSLVNGLQTTGTGAGLYANDVQVILQNVVVQNNQSNNPAANLKGAGIANGGFMSLLYSQVVKNSETVGYGGGAGIFNEGGLTILRSQVNDNMITASTPVSLLGGAGILNSGALELYQSAVERNTYTNGYGGGMFNLLAGRIDITASLVDGNMAMTGAGIYNGADMSLISSTISGNAATADGGGIYNAAGKTIAMRGVTLTDNSADSDHDTVGDGGGLLNGSGSVVSLSNSILAGNHDPSLVNGVLSQDCAGTLPASQGYNLTGCGVLGQPGDLNIANPLLGPLQNNGGPTFTQTPLPGSPALKAGYPMPPDDSKFAYCTNLDQRNVLRPDQALSCDIGAFQTVGSIAVNDAGDSHDVAPGDGVCLDSGGRCTLRAALEEAGGKGFLTPVSVPSGLKTISLPFGPLTPSGDAYVIGPGAGLLTLDALQNGAGLWIDAHRAVLMRGMTFANGKGTPAGGGGNVFVRGDLTLQDVSVRSGYAGIGGGIAVMPEGVLTLENSDVVNNQADTGGGGLLIYGSLEMNNVTVAGNTSKSDGGGLELVLGGVAKLNNVTIATNTADSDHANGGSGGGYAMVGSRIVLEMANSILAGNTSLSSQSPDCFGSLVSFGYNLFGDTTGCTITPGTGDQSGANPRLSPLTFYGSGTSVLPFQGNSPALNAGNPAAPGGAFPACLASDQHGTPRPQVTPGQSVLRCDIGAFEAYTLHTFLPSVRR